MVCALYIPEVTFGSVSSMEPIILQKVPPERFNKVLWLHDSYYTIDQRSAFMSLSFS